MSGGGNSICKGREKCKDMTTQGTVSELFRVTGTQNLGREDGARKEDGDMTVV